MWCGKASTVILGLVVAGSAQAEDLGARSLARGGVGRADALDGAGGSPSLAANALEDQYLAYTGGLAAVDHTWGLRAGAVDTRTSKVSLSLGYYRRWDTLPRTGDDLPGWKPPGDDLLNPAIHQGAAGALAYPMLDRKLAIGADARVDFFSSDLLPSDWAFNFGVQAAARPTESLTLSAAVTNLLETGFRDTERSLELGARFDAGTYFGVEGDAVAPLTTEFAWPSVGWHLGADVGIAEPVALRAGFSSDDGRQYVSGGLGLLSKNADLDYGMRIQLSDASRTWHQLDLRVKF
jgi:hypothetical protein